jgi:hypothetical protein
MKAIEESSQRAAESASKSTEAAGAAGAAAAEARQLTESLQGMIAEAAERTRQETTSYFQDAVRQVEQAGASSQQQGQELQAKLDAAAAQLESSLTTARELAAQAASSADAARQAAAEATSTSAETTSVARAAADAAQSANGQVAALRDVVAGIESSASNAAAEAARSTASEIAALREAVAAAERVASEAAATAARTTASEVTSLRAAVAGAERTAAEARQVALEASAIVQAQPLNTEPSVSAGAQEVLERLEADYSLLTKLVQELHARIASLSAQTSPVYQFIPPAQRQEPDVNPDVNIQETHELKEPPASNYEETAMTGDETVAEMPAADEPVAPSSWDEPAATAAESWNAARFAPTPETPVEPEVPSESQASHEVEPAAEITPDEPAATTEEPAVEKPAAEAAADTIAGRVLVSISPVPDFDRLLSLDGALGRMSGIGNVTLADYAREEVTFRVEVDPPTSVEDFRDRLSASAGASIEVVASGGDGLALRLAS